MSSRHPRTNTHNAAAYSAASPSGSDGVPVGHCAGGLDPSYIGVLGRACVGMLITISIARANLIAIRRLERASGQPAAVHSEQLPGRRTRLITERRRRRVAPGEAAPNALTSRGMSSVLLGRGASLAAELYPSAAPLVTRTPVRTPVYGSDISRSAT